MKGLTGHTIDVYGRIKKLGSFRNGCYKRMNMVSEIIVQYLFSSSIELLYIFLTFR